MRLECAECGAVIERIVSRASRAAVSFCSRACRYSPAVTERRFWSMVSKGEGDACWTWTGFCEKSQSVFCPVGYGKFTMGNKDYVAHRASWILNVGPIPEGMRVLHRCDNPPCIRPDHLFLGTLSDNALDASAKGRYAHRKGHRKLTPEQESAAVAVYRGGSTQSDVARMFNITQTGVSAIVRRNGASRRTA